MAPSSSLQRRRHALYIRRATAKGIQRSSQLKGIASAMMLDRCEIRGNTPREYQVSTRSLGKICVQDARNVTPASPEEIPKNGTFCLTPRMTISYDPEIGRAHV